MTDRGGGASLLPYTPAGVKGCTEIMNITDSCECTVLDMPESREMAQQIDLREKQLSQVACISDLMS